ncbi:type II secretion system F family protein [Paenibacillus tarimensis]|uniref:type II secretion system F family protein n=1 Tax=Paenibacillus tarimensis TaxID=416012 RepID=UPI001F3258B3|nr:type II secretion system F family protein [Paenibacillus tarimensis]MCF2943541.1 type II secretion system F family protein [Paenibacillus tarimensis]
MQVLIVVVLAGLWGWMLWNSEQVSRKRENGLQAAASLSQLERLIGRPFLLALEKWRLFDMLQSFLTVLHARLLLVEGETVSPRRSRMFIAETVGLGYASLTGLAVLGLLADEPAMLAMGLLILVLVPASRIRGLFNRVEERRREMVRTLPDLLSKLMLLVGAGETVQSALFRCAEAGKEDHPLYNELRRAMNAYRNGEPFGQSLEAFGKRCGVQEVSVFTAVLLLNSRKGGDSFVVSLRELSLTLWEKRKALAKVKGEEASSKLAFPLTAIFFVLMVLVGAPAVLMMS